MRTIILSILAGPALLSAALLSGCVPFPSTEGEALPAGATTSETEAGAGFPEAMQGRWGLVPADCEPGRADAKGLMVVGEDDLTFYESRGRIAAVDRRSADRIEADLAYEGEGMTWQRYEVLALTADGRLERVATGEGAVPGTLSYTACPG